MSFHLTRRLDDGKRGRLRKGMYLLPSMFTTLNLAAGFYAIVRAVQGSANQVDFWQFDYAAKAIGIAVLFDGLDGTIARLTNTTSDFGKELDSLADVVTFGVAPAVLAWMWGFRQLPLVLDDDLRKNLIQFGVIACFVFLAAGAMRLARFNITLNPQPKNPGRPGKKYFVGMPIPGGAGCLAAVVHFRLGQPVQVWWSAVLWIGYILLCAFLMVSTWRFWSTKSIDFKTRKPARFLLIFVVFAGMIWFFSRYVLIGIAMLYMISGLLARLLYSLQKPSQPAAPNAPAADPNATPEGSSL
jgi:CDP-diacylglycerol--serine O-phosphatidyltransferase